MRKNKKEKIAAVVVTYNRKKLLQECLDSLLKQTKPLDSIIIMNNASTDGTEEMLRKKYLKNPIFDYVNLGENTGGAGGFHYGIKRAYEKEFDWIWCMDDDVVLKDNALKELLKVINKNKNIEFGFLCSRVIGVNGLSMNTPSVDTKKGRNNYPIWDELLDQACLRIRRATFVSFLLNKISVKKLGFPIKDFFIWGDDTEYSLRITSQMPAYLVGKSLAVHKRHIQKPPNILTEKDFQRIKFFFYMYRNDLYTKKCHSGNFFLFASFLKTIFIFLMCFFNSHYPLLKAKIVSKALIAYLLFNPVVEFPKKFRKNMKVN
jgi:GT2 family glycosyltransferase